MPFRPDGARDADVCVVGAGLAGLTTARDLVAAGVDVVVLEARERVGGRTLNEPVGDGADQVVELGGQWIGPTQDRVAALAASLGVATYPTHADGADLFEHAGKLTRFTGRVPWISPVTLTEVGVALLRLNRMSRAVPLEAPWAAPRARRWDEETFASWLRRNVRSEGARELVRMAIEGVWAADAADLSLLHVLFYIRSAGSLELLTETVGGAQQDRFVGGSQVLSLRLAEALGDRVVLGAPVRRVTRSGEAVVVAADGGVAVRCARVVVAIPPPLAGRLVYDPPMPEQRDGLTQRTAMGSVVKCMAIYDEPFWRAGGLSGQATSTTGPAKVFYDNSPPGGRPGVLLAFLEGREARAAARMEPAQRRETVLGSLGRLFGPRARTPERYVDQAWALEEFSRGCYGAYLPPGAWTDYGPAVRRPVDRVHWAGAETATIWNGYMDGAVRSGERAAAEVAAALGARRSGALVGA